MGGSSYIDEKNESAKGSDTGVETTETATPAAPPAVDAKETAGTDVQNP